MRMSFTGFRAVGLRANTTRVACPQNTNTRFTGNKNTINSSTLPIHNNNRTSVGSSSHPLLYFLGFNFFMRKKEDKN
jgi:hypothetical protein